MSRSAQLETKLESARKILLERQHLQTSLQDFFLSLQKGSLYTKKLPGDNQESLIAIFDHGIDPNPAFSGPVLTRIYLDEKKQLSMALWPLESDENKRPWRNEILLSDVEDFQFHFLGEKTEPGIASVNSKLAWYDHWPQKRLETPSMIRLIIRKKNESLSYAFFLTNPEPFVTYWEEGYKT